MAKYLINFSCGHAETIELFGKETERQRKIEYFEECGMCKDCYRQKKMQEEKEKGLRFNITSTPRIDKNGNILVCVYFDGDTMPHKDEIKDLGGYVWSERETVENILSLKYVPKCWNKAITIEDLADEVEKAAAIGATVIGNDDSLFATMDYQIAKKMQEKYKTKKEKMDAIPKPLTPEKLKGKYWNGKIYGKKGNYSIYPDSQKTMITDEEAAEIETYLQEKEEYEKKISAID